VTPITNVETACIRLGQSVVKAISIAIAVASAFNISRCPVFDTVRFWTTCMLVSEGAGLLATKLPNKASYALDIEQTVQTGGILHNMGLLWLAENFAMETAEALLLTMADPSLTVNQALMEGIGIDYCGTGAWIGRQWGIPDELIVVMQHHRDAPYQENVSAEVLLVGAAARMASSLFQKTIEMPSNPALQSLGIDELVQREVFTQLLNKFDSTKELSKILFL
jgi:HD-like signal output (HDOD) protein